MKFVNFVFSYYHQTKEQKQHYPIGYMFLIVYKFAPLYCFFQSV